MPCCRKHNSVEEQNDLEKNKRMEELMSKISHRFRWLTTIFIPFAMNYLLAADLVDGYRTILDTDTCVMNNCQFIYNATNQQNFCAVYDTNKYVFYFSNGTRHFYDQKQNITQAATGADLTYLELFYENARKCSETEKRLTIDTVLYAVNGIGIALSAIFCFLSEVVIRRAWFTLHILLVCSFLATIGELVVMEFIFIPTLKLVGCNICFGEEYIAQNLVALMLSMLISNIIQFVSAAYGYGDIEIVRAAGTRSAKVLFFITLFVDIVSTVWNMTALIISNTH